MGRYCVYVIVYYKYFTTVTGNDCQNKEVQDTTQHKNTHALSCIQEHTMTLKLVV